MTRGSRKTIAGIAVAALGVATAAAFAASPNAKQDVFTAANGWYAVADGVYEHQQPDGSITRFAYGPGGAEFDRANLQRQLAELEAQRRGPAASADALEQRTAELKAALAVIPDNAGGDVQPFSSTTGTFCSKWQYYFDTHFVVGNVGATAVSRVVLTPISVGLPPPAPTSVATSTSATVTPASGAITSTNTGSTYKDVVSAIADWTPTNLGSVIASNSCTGATSSSVSVNPGITCSGAVYASTSQSYATCTTSP